MISEKMKELVKGSSVIRAMFEEGNRLASIYGRENVYDFSLGNPNVPAPSAVKKAIEDILETEDPLYVHGYMSNTGYPEVRKAVADNLNKRFETSYDENNIIMSVGAASGLNVIFKTLLNPGDEVITFAPFFGEYRNYVANYDGILNVIPADTDTFQPDLPELEKRINNRTKAVLINSPNNPAGVVYSEETMVKLSEILDKKQKEFSSSIYLVTDEPYRELVYDGIKVPFVPCFYRNTLVCYSFSKSMSLPGERIGYIVIPSEVDDKDEVFSAAGVATRILGYVNAPSLIQLAVAKCLDESADISFYDRNRNTLYNALREYGFECKKPEGAFYLFMKTPCPDDREFCEKAKKHNILIVPGTTFGCSGYVRIAYCVSYETVLNSLSGFKKLAMEYGL